MCRYKEDITTDPREVDGDAKWIRLVSIRPGSDGGRSVMLTSAHDVATLRAQF
jgi:hypothetical protein